MRKIALFFVLLFAISSYSQESEFWKNFRLGGRFGLSFGNNTTSISVSPTVVYDFNEEFSMGASIGYLYNKTSNFNANVYSSSIIIISLLDKLNFLVSSNNL